MTRALIDVNVLLALLDSDHVDHRRAWDWMGEEVGQGWASCAITQNGFVRILSQPRYPTPVSPSEAIERLAEACSTEYHEYWSCSMSLLDDAVLDPRQLHDPRQVTDAYLLALAVHHEGRLVRFDQSVPLQAVRGAEREHLMVL